MTDTPTLHILPQLFKATVLRRPSASIKSPYVADIRLEKNGESALCHSPGLGCSGLVTTERIIYVSESKPGSKTSYTTQISENNDQEGSFYVGIHPMVSQKVASKLLDRLLHKDVTWKHECKISEETRLDFVGTLDQSGRKIYVEVKNAMISNYSSEPRSLRRAIFPVGHRKSKSESFSPRAVKHAEKLSALMKNPDTESAYLIFIVPRNDCLDGLELNTDDSIYCYAVRKAISCGVQVKVFGIEFKLDGSVNFFKELPFHLSL